LEIALALCTKTEPPRPAERRAKAVEKMAKVGPKLKLLKDAAKALV
jgi:hypothetical protein